MRSDLSNEAQHGNHRLLVSFDRPELSPLLARLPPSQTAARAELIAILEAGRQAMTQTPRGDGRNFTPCAADLSRNQRYQRRAEVEAANRAAIRDGRKRHDGDPVR